MKALIVVDVQYDFLPGGSLAVPDGDKIIPVINRIMKNFDVVVATQDWHPAGHISFASTHEGRQPFEVIELSYGKQTLWPDHCVQGTKGAQLVAELDLNPVEVIIRKGTNAQIDSYSAFYDNGRQKTTGLSGYLKSKGVSEVYVCGLATDVCVYHTAKDSLSEGFQTFVILSASMGLSEASITQTMNHIKQLGGIVLETIE